MSDVQHLVPQIDGPGRRGGAGQIDNDNAQAAIWFAAMVLTAGTAWLAGTGRLGLRRAADGWRRGLHAGDAPDSVAGIVRDQESAGLVDRDADRTPVRRSAFADEAGEEVLRRPGRRAILEGHEDHLV